MNFCSLMAGSNSMIGRTIRIGVVAKSQSNPVFIAAYAGARVAAKEIGERLNVDVIIDWQTPPNEDPEKQAEAIKQLVRTGAAGIAVACSDANILTPVIDQVVESGTQVLCFDSDAPKSRRFSYYGSDDTEFGRMMMKALAAEMNERGVIALIAGNKNAPNLQQRVHAIAGEIKKYPSMKILPDGVFYHAEIPEKAAEMVARAQKKYPQIEGWAFVGAWPLFIQDGLKIKSNKIKIVAADALPSELEYIKNGQVQTLIAQNCFQWGYKAIEILLNKIIKNENPAAVMNYGPLTLVTKDNLEEWSLNWRKWLLKEAVSR